MKKREKHMIRIKYLMMTACMALLLSGTIPAQQFNMEQTLSDGAQQMTISFDALAFFSGTIGSDSFFPPGKVADFWGFQYLRDNDPSQMGHNTDFLTKASYNMISILDSTQYRSLKALAQKQIATINQYGLNRFVFMKAFRRLAEGDTPAGKTQLSKDAVKDFSKQLYLIDGQMSYERAKVMGGIIKSLNASQRAYLDALKGKGMLTWPSLTEPTVLKDLTRDEKIAVMTYGGDLFSWYVGSLDADVYFCPERHGTYFGSFYLKDAPAVGNPNYTIGSNLTADYGDSLLTTLTQSQGQLIKNLVPIQKPFLLEMVNKREAVSQLLRQFIAGITPDSAAVISLMADYGNLDGELNFNYASNFAFVYKSLNAAQKEKLSKFRHDLIGDLAPDGAFLYSTPIALPAIINTDFLFSSVVSAVTSETQLPKSYILMQNYPNPFNPSTVIKFSVPAGAGNISSHVLLKVYDMLGRDICTLVDSYCSPGNYSVQFNTTQYSLTSGVYLYALKAGSSAIVKKMVLLR